MNRSYRHVWSAARGAYLIAPETARSKGKSGRAIVAPAVASVVAGLAFGLPGAASAQINLPTTVVPVAGKTNAYLAPNGVPVVNINTANAAGVSHNQYNRYDVDAKGLVLNNNSYTQAPALQSQLAGQVVGNLNLSTSAKVILNEVVSTNRSTLAGYTEVLGGRADVIVANQYGITCNGCGFINTDRVTLTTGLPVFGADGSLTGFNVHRGDILLNGAGLNASAQQILDIVTRSVKVDGQLNMPAAGTLGIATGTNAWSYATRSVTGAVAPALDDAKPSYAIDSTALGGMYAGRIRLIATEAGVGVRMLGDAAASAEDFRVDAAGKVLVQSRVSAARDLQVNQTGSTAAAQVEVAGSGASLSAGRDLALDAQGGVTLTEAQLKAGNNLALQAASLADTSTANASRSAGANVDLMLAGAANLDGTSWGAGSHLTLGAASLAVGATGTTIYSGTNTGSADRSLTLATSGDMAMTKATLTSAANLTASSSGGALNLAGAVDMTAAADLALNAKTSFDNAGQLMAGHDLTLRASDAGTVLQASNTGLLQAQSSMSIGENGKPVALANAANGKVLADSIGFTGTTLGNSGTIQATNGLGVTASGSVANHAGAVMLSTAAGKDVTLSAASLDNAGNLQSSGKLTATVAGAANNSGQLLTTAAADGGSDGALSLSSGSLSNSGTIAAAGAGSIATAGAFDNSKQVQANTLAIEATGALRNLGPDGVLLSQAGMTVHGASVDNSGVAQAGANMAVTADGALTNSAVMQTRDAGGTLSLQGAAITNSATVQAAGAVTLLSTAGAISNSGQVTAGTDLDLVAATAVSNSGANSVLLAQSALRSASATFENSGAVQAGSLLDVATTGALTNSAALQTVGAASDLALSGANIDNSGDVQAAGTAHLASTVAGIDNSGKVQAAGDMALAAATALYNRAGAQMLTGSNLSATAGTVDNAGTLQAGDSFTLAADGAVANSGTVQTTGTSALSLDAASLSNTGTVQAGGTADVTTRVGAIDNTGRVLADGDMTLSAATVLNNATTGQVVGQQSVLATGSGNFDLWNAGRIQAAGDLTIGEGAHTAYSVYNANGATLFGDNVNVNGGDIINQGRIQAMGNGTLTGANLSNLGSTAVVLFGLNEGEGNINLSGFLHNEGAVHTGGRFGITANRIDNTGTAGISSLDSLTLTATGSGIDNAGALYAANTLTTTALGQTVNNFSTGTMDASDIVVSAGTFSNYNTVIAGHDANITTTVAFNNLPTGGVPHVITANTSYGGVSTPYDSGDYNCNVFGDYCDHLWVHAQNYTVTQGLDGAMPTQKGQVIAGSTLNLNYGQAGTNTASLISAPTININGSGAFVNTDLHLDQITYARRWRVYKTDSTFGDLNYDYRFPTDGGQFGCNDGGCFGGHAGSESGAADSSYGLETGRTTIQVWSAGIYATDLHFSGGSLKNLGSPYTRSTSATTVAGESAATVSPLSGAGLSAVAGVSVSKVSNASRAASVPAANGVTFTGLNLNLPANPNGYFVQAKNPTAKYLVETNPLFAVGNNGVGSDYLSKLMGLDPEKQQKRLGDANYEAKLVRDQLVAQTGNNIIKGQKNEAAQLQALMDNAATQAKGLGMVFGQPLSAAQAASLTEDMVWMVEQEVNGQKVLVPVVYLAQSTRDAIEGGGPVIAATNADIKAGTLENTGGTIAGDKLAITTEGDLRNTGGKIKGGDVSVKSTNGSIINETVANTQGGKDFARTVIGATGSIESTGSLSLDAAKDITVKGANVKAGGDASLAAGGAVTFDTIQDKSADSTYKASQGLWGLESSSSSTHTATTTNIGSGLETGGNLKIKSGGDTTIAGSQVKVGGNLDMDAAGNVNIVSRQDTVETSNSSSHTGLGVGGGLYGGTTTTTDTFKGRNVAAGIEVAGDANLNAGNTLTLQGSKLKVDGNASVNATDVQVLAGQDVDRSTTTTTTTSFLKISGSGDTSAGAGAGAGSNAVAGASSKGGKANAGASASAGAGAGAEASASANAGLTLAETTTTTSSEYHSKAVGSELEIGGNLSVNAKKDVVLQGATVNTGGDTELKGQNVKILASQDVDISTTKTTTTSVGLFVDSENKAGAGANAGASAGAQAGVDRGSQAGANAEAGAHAGAAASSDTTIDLVRTSTTETNSLDIHNNGTTINAGGKLKIDAADKLTVQGSDIGGEQGVSLKAKDMSFEAAQDVSVTSTTTSRTSAGLYISGGANAEAGAHASANASASHDSGGQGAGGGFDAGAGASADAKIGAGWQAKTTTEKSTEGTTTARVSTIRSGSGDIERTATNSITDVGTAIDAAGDFSQEAKTIDSRAAKNTSFSSSSSETNQLKIGVYAQANASASASASGSADASAGLLGAGSGNKMENGAEAGANASVGVEAQFSHEQSSARSDSSEAVVSTIHAGGKVKSKSLDKTTFEGTQISGDGGVELEAKSIDFKAAKNTESSSESGLSVNAEAHVGLNLGSDGAVEGGVAGGFEKNASNSSSSTAVTGSIQSGAGLTIKTQGDARFEGTDIGAAGDASVSAGGKLTFDAARNESSESSNSASAEASLSISKSKSSSGHESGMGLEASGGFENESSKSSEAVTGKIAAGGNLKLSSGKDMSFEGTNVQAGGDTGIEAGGKVDFNAARNTSSSESSSLSASLSLSKSSSSDSAKGESSKSHSAGIGVDGGYAKETSSEAVAGSLETGGNLKIKSGGSATFEGTDIAAGGKAAISAGGDVNFKAAESTHESVGVSASLGAETSTSHKTGGKAGGEAGTAAPAAKPGSAAGGAAAAAGGAEPAAGPETEKEHSGSFGLEAGYEKSSEKKGGSLKAGGGIDISAGGNANFEGTQVKSDGDIAVAAKGDVNVTTAKSTSTSVGVSVEGEHERSSNSAEPDAKSSSTRAGFGIDAGASSTNEGASFESGGKLNIASGGRTTLVSTEIKADGGQQVAAAGGVVRSTAVDTDSGIKMSAVARHDSPAPAAPAAEQPAAPAQGMAAAAAGIAAPKPAVAAPEAVAKPEAAAAKPAVVKPAAKPKAKPAPKKPVAKTTPADPVATPGGKQ